MVLRISHDNGTLAKVELTSKGICATRNGHTSRLSCERNLIAIATLTVIVDGLLDGSCLVSAAVVFGAIGYDVTVGLVVEEVVLCPVSSVRL